MFKLLRYFSITSGIALLLVTILLATLYRQLAVQQLIEQGEAENVSLTQLLSNTIWPRFARHLASASQLTNDELRAHPETANVRQAILAHVRGLPIIKVKIYNLEGLTVFSTQDSQIGEDKSTNSGVLSALSGMVASELTHRNTFSAFEQTIENRDVLSSYIPVRGNDGRVEGVFEVYADLTSLLMRIKDTQLTIVLYTLGVFLVLYCVLFLIVRHADRIINRQRNEIVANEEKLRQKAKMDALGQLAGGIAHDLNNVLVPIIGLTEMTIRKLPAESRERSSLKKVLISACRAKELVKQILAFSRKEEPEYQSVKLQHVLGDCLRLLRATLPTTITIRAHIDEDCGSILADVTQIDQVMMNLAANANTAMGTKGGVLEITLEKLRADDHLAAPTAHLKPGPYARIKVRDTGCGMDKATIERIFDPFFTTTPVGEGTGMGLSVVHGIVTGHGGTITVSSELGQGTTFEIYLPLCEEERPSTLPGVEPAFAAREDPLSGKTPVVVAQEQAPSKAPPADEEASP